MGSRDPMFGRWLEVEDRCDASGVGVSLPSSGSGGIATLNHRLIAEIPSGLETLEAHAVVAMSLGAEIEISSR